MTNLQKPPAASLNSRVGALALTVCAPLNILLHLQGPSLGPLSYAVWVGLSFGLLCFCDEMGAARPLNRAGLVALAAIGAVVGGGALVLLVGAHLLLGAATILGFSQLFAALQQPGHSTLAALVLIDSVLCAWSLPIAALLWTARLRR